VLGGRIRYGARVTGVSRRGRDRLVDGGRAGQPFTVHVTWPDGRESRLEARAVIDASGTWERPAPAGADGLPALGERAAADLLSYRLPGFADRGAFSGRHTVVLGSGHSALTAISELAPIAMDSPGTRVSWVIRRGGVGASFGGGTADQLPERGALGLRARQAVDAGLVKVVTGFRVERIEATDRGAVLIAEDGPSLPAADQVLVLTGMRPDLSFLSEVRLELDAALEAPVRLAAGIDPNLHSCGDVAATGAAELAHPEPDLYLVGMKSYGRAPTFLAMTGYEQVRSIAAELAGDHEAAARVELVLPDTGVCGGSGLFDEPVADDDGGCCAPAPEVVQIGHAGLSSTH
jgi:thioredoxin reductase